MSDNKITIEVDGQLLEAENGQMLIEVTDHAGIYIPRFCYHNKLSIAANCRMCLVEMEKGRKPMPACATPVGNGMKFFTRSKEAIAAQRATMEFLLINHPLDCPICDQGGECELQDLAMGYGRGISRYTEAKRAVQDKELGPLVSTDMTRCIHCTRCVRFGEEIAGIQELGTIGRGEHVEIAPYIEKTVDHELSGNIIDLCPVGALNSKPFRFRARSWEMTQSALVSPHDCFGSNLNAHVLRGKIMRIVPGVNEAINETWISDRDRFAYEGLHSDERLTTPMVKRDGQWHEVEWSTALSIASDIIKQTIEQGPQEFGALVAPWSTAEELHLFERMVRGLGSANIDHRLKQRDFSKQQSDASYPGFEMSIVEVEKQDAILVVGSALRREVPMMAHRVRKAQRAGAQVMFISESNDEYLFDPHIQLMGANILHEVAAVAMALDVPLPASLQSALPDVAPRSEHYLMVEALKNAERSGIVLGHAASRDAHYHAIRALSSTIAQRCNSTVNILSDAANSVGAALLGCLPHRVAGGGGTSTTGLNALEMLRKKLKSYVLFGMEVEHDCVGGQSFVSTLADESSVICVSSYVTDSMKDYADVMLPLAAFGESSGTFVNCEGRWQSFAGAAKPLGESRPGWKILRVLSNELGLSGFDFVSPSEVLDSAKKIAQSPHLVNRFDCESLSFDADEVEVASAHDLYSTDPIVRRSKPLQQLVSTDTTEPVLKESA